MNFRKFWPGFRHLRPFPDRPDQISSLTELLTFQTIFNSMPLSISVWVLARLEIGSGLSGNGLRCLDPGQKFRKFNSDHFPFFKNLNRTSGSRVSLPRLEIGSGRSGNGLRCLEPVQNFRKFNSEHFPFLKNLNRTSGSRVSLPAQKNTS